MKAPLDGGLNNTQSINASTSANEGTLFGTLAITPKVLLHQSDGWAMSGGLAIGLPTSPNAALEGGPRPIQVFDDSVHLAPFSRSLSAAGGQSTCMDQAELAQIRNPGGAGRPELVFPAPQPRAIAPISKSAEPSIVKAVGSGTTRPTSGCRMGVLVGAVEM